MKYTFLLVLLLLPVCLYAQFRQKKQTYGSTAIELTQNLNSDSAKIRAIYTWVTSNINYDYRSFMSGEPYRYQSAELVFYRRRTTCTGFTNLMVAMLDTIGIPAFEIEGYTRDMTLGLNNPFYNADHSWVAFRCDGSWYACDPTWDSGQIGFLPDIQERETWIQAILNKIRRWRFWRIFWSKKRKAEAEKKATKPQQKITRLISFRIGFVQDPRSDYFFQKPEVMAKDHLPSLGHWQMQTAPVSVPEFQDSLYLMSDTIYKRTGRLNYNSLNEIYYGLNYQERKLYLADSLFRFNPDNFGDKGNHLYAYLVFENATRAKSPEMRDSLLPVCDSVNMNVNRALKDLKAYNMQKKASLKRDFMQENVSDKNKQKSLTYMQNLLLRVETVYTKGIQNESTKGAKKIQDYQRRTAYFSDSIQHPGQLKIADSLYWKDKIPNYQKRLDSIRQVQSSLFWISDSLSARIMRHFEGTIRQYEQSLTDVRNISMVYEKRIRWNDSVLEKQFLLVTKTIRDSVLPYFKPTASMQALIALQQEIAGLSQSPGFKDTKQNKQLLNYFNKELNLLFQREYELMEERLGDASAMQGFIKYTLSPLVPVFKSALMNLSMTKKKRQKYMYDYLHMKVNRVVKLYSYDLRNTKTIRSLLKQIKDPK